MTNSQQVHRPLVGVALAMLAGLYLQRLFSLPAFLLLASSSVALSVAFWSTRGRRLAVFSACLLLAAAHGAVERTRTPADAVLPMAETLASRQELTGVVVNDPERSEDGDAVVFRLKVTAVHLDGIWWKAASTIRVRMKGPDVPVVYGERWHLAGLYRSYNRSYSGQEGSFYTSSGDAERLQKAPPSLKAVCYQLRRRAAPVFRAGITSLPEHSGLLQALLLGYRNRLPHEMQQMFSRSGTLHIFAISGLHVGVMAAILIAVLKLIGVSRPKWGLFLIPLLFFYVVSTGMKPSAFRAFTMASVYFAAPLVRRRPDSVSAIALSAVILLLINPLRLGDPGFLLSFTVVSGIVMVHHYVARRLSGFARPAWAVPLARLSGRHPLMTVGRTIGLLALTSAAAWVFSVPLTALFFNTISPAALVANLAVIPLTFMIVLTGCLSLLSAAVWDSAILIFNHANRVFISLLAAGIRIAQTLPGASCRFVASPSAASMALWYGGLVFLFAAPRRWSRAGVPLVLSAAILWFASGTPDVEGVQIGKEAGAAVLVGTEKEAPVLVARGSAYSLSRATRRLQREGVNRLAALAVCGTRVDADALSELCETFSVPCVWMLPVLENGRAAHKSAQTGTRVLFSETSRWHVGDGTVSVDLN